MSLLLVVLAALTTTGCSDFWGKPDEDPNATRSASIAPDYESDTLTVNIVLTDEGPEPSTVFIPAGRHIMLVFRNRGRHEHHYRVQGLVPEHMAWMRFPEIDEYELESLTQEELDALDLGGALDDVEHSLHHLRPVFVPFREASRSGIKPLANEVHAYAQAGQVEAVTFYATTSGRFVVEDVRYPDLTAELVVFEPAS